ncbi:MAG: hypothetical protein FJZ08_00165 [Candidatus Omnitrophica bacterium]|nr:hypothetical protein [Candidatus Omnitrophota bacterium]
MAKKENGASDRRQYIRLDSVFPVEFNIASLDGRDLLSDWLQGFTNDIGRGGICLTANNLNPELAAIIKAKQVKLSLGIEMPFSKKPISAVAKVAWVQDVAEQPNKYLIGLAYEQISETDNDKIMRYARAKQWFVPFVMSVIIILGLAFAVNSYINIKLIRGNKALVQQLVNTLQDSSVAKQKIKDINKEREDLETKIQAFQERIKKLEEDRGQLSEKSELAEVSNASKLKELGALINKLSQEKAALQGELDSLQHKESAVSAELVDLGKRKASLEKANIDKMYQWLKVHQNPRSGLVMSFEGDGDVNNWAFTYDQSLVLQAYTYFDDFERAKKMLEFFDKKAQRRGGNFINAYYVDDGLPAEEVVHSGPNIWLGIAIIQYTQKSQDRSYLKLAEDIAQAIIVLQNEDKDGGIRGGPNFSWYATEHHLDAYAFFNMLYKMSPRPIYLEARDKVLSWLIQHTYGKTDLPVKRGRGDSTIATDTYAWSIAAIGPEKLETLGMNPDKIMEFAEQNCGIEVDYTRPEGTTIKMKGFDFAAQTHLARGGIISSEWTAQMIISFKIIADYYAKKELPQKAGLYMNKAEEYLAELGNMIISSPSPSGQGESCLPYATQDSADTGHGWATPKGKFTGSVAGTAYTIFAYYNYNPLELKE